VTQNSIVVYQIHAIGPRAYFDGVGKMISRKVYSCRGDAEANIEKFKAECMGTEADAADLLRLEAVDRIAIIELELIGGEDGSTG
jgi:hypothetical protein